MRNVLSLAAVVASLALLGADAPKGLKSGVQVGGKVGAFEVLDVTGPNKDKKICYVCQNGAKPVTIIFTREINKEVAALVKAVDAAQKDSKKGAAFLVLLDKDAKAGAEKLKKLQAETGVSIPLTVNDAGEDSPKGYELAKDVKTTVLVYKEQKVVSNFALNAISEKEVAAIAEAAKKNAQG